MGDEPTADRTGSAPRVRPGRFGVDAATAATTATAVHVGSLVVGYIGLLVLLRGTWFRGDDFEFLANRVGPTPVFDLWMPHNEHWSTGPIVLWRVLYDAFGMTSVVPYLAISLVAHVAAAHLLWRLMLRAGVDKWVATGLAATFVFLGAGYENITWAFQLGFMGSLALGLLALLLLTGAGRGAFVAAAAVAIVSLTFSGMSLPLVGMAVVYLLVTRRWRGAVVFAAATGAVYLLWFLPHGRNAQIPPHSQGRADRLANAAPWVWRGLTSALEALTSAPGVGALLLVALGAWLARRVAVHLARGDDLRSPSWGLSAAFVLGVVGQLWSLAVNRGDISLPETSRYAYAVIALLLPLVGLVLSDARAAWSRALVGLLVCYLVLTQGLVLLARERPLEYPQLQRDVQGVGYLLEQGEPLFPTTLAVDVSDVTIGRWADQGVLGDLTTLEAQTVSDGRALSQVRLQPILPAGAGPAGLTSDGGAVAPGSCVTEPTVPGARAASVTLAPSTTVSVVADRAGELVYRVVDPGPASRAVVVPLVPNLTYWFTATVPLALDVMTNQGQELRVCSG